MKNILLFLLMSASMLHGQIVNIPDANFKSKLLAASTSNTIACSNGNYRKIDLNNDGEIQLSEATTIDSLNVNNSSILDLEGISAFNNLKSLQCANNQLSGLNISNLTQLKKLFCAANNLGTLNLNGLVDLEELFIYGINISTLDLTGLTNLKVLEVSTNFLTSIDLSPVPNLVEFRCIENQLSSLDLSGLTQLKILDCCCNQITSLDLSGLSHLINVDCSNNLLTTLDLSQQTSLQILDCYSNDLHVLVIKNGIGNGNQLQFFGNPNLEFICVDVEEVQTVQLLLTTYGNVGCVVNTYCSFTPGGNYNTINGNVKYDSDNNGCDVTDIIPTNVRFNINDGISTGATFANNNGDYIFYTPAGSFDISPVIENPTWFTFSPTSATIPFANNNNNSATQNFCITPVGLHQDLEIVLVPIFPARPGFDAAYELVLRNKGNQFMNDWTGVRLQYDDSKMSFVSSSQVNSSTAAGVLEWGYFLEPFQTQTIQVVFHINAPTDVNPVVIGDQLTFTAVLNPIDTDEFPADNTYVFNQTVVGSYDPNNIICLEGDVVPPTEIGNYLHYAINFENTGTYPAENVVVKTEVDASKFDINSLQLMSANFPVDARITENKVEFIFKNIQLPIGGHGHILLKIKTKNTLVTGDSVSNRGDIFFDYNAPIDTGLAHTIFENLSNTGFEADSSVVVTPNPAAHFVSVQANNPIKSVEVYDIQGRVIQTSIINKNESKLDINSYSSGTYFIKIVTEKGAQVQKIVKK